MTARPAIGGSGPPGAGVEGAWPAGAPPRHAKWLVEEVA